MNETTDCSGDYSAVKLLHMAKAARCIDESDYNTERQINAENAFFTEVGKVLNPEDYAKLEGYALHGTVDENVDYALQLLKLK